MRDNITPRTKICEYRIPAHGEASIIADRPRKWGVAILRSTLAGVEHGIRPSVAFTNAAQRHEATIREHRGDPHLVAAATKRAADAIDQAVRDTQAWTDGEAARGRWSQEYLARILRIVQQEREAVERPDEPSSEEAGRRMG